MTEKIIYECVGIKAGVPTTNGRIYTEECLKKTVDECQQKIKDNLLFVTRQTKTILESSVDISTIAGKVVECQFNPEKGYVSIGVEFLDTPFGKEVSLGVSARGMRITPQLVVNDIPEDNVIKEAIVQKFLAIDNNLWS